MRKLFDGIPVDGSHKTPPLVMLREVIEPRPITSRTRTGRAFFIDTFEEYTAIPTEKWYEHDGTIALVTDYPKQGKTCMSLTTGANATDDAQAILSMGAFPKSRFGMEFDFQCDEAVANITYTVSYTHLTLPTILLV